mmetsp:Transcript_32752/g.75771  ORF Transcript_32752/g.75771 Transcript_32752/m.75771 type:complete len:235 (+) Transcript_32752:62-766(+)|eukprot:CAMPEP_0182573108 /NCGR_PEP_ID=MMETSP1324-20130603/18220_1 /TAXON_ID=236786 /ORGANISM="Florenciella sp., Strain RCC1587" /LENGTH=234 /DNA_ID=CAMNT_0024788151 /DNA_START=57 /DNA_END=761 /DNA_ORIENTATION=+
MVRTAVLALLALASSTSADTTTLVTFDGADDATNFVWYDMNDPVMGGASTSTFKIEEDSGSGVFNGTCAIVESLAAPGFCKAYTYHPLGHDEVFPDASAHIDGGLTIKLSTTSPDYTGFKVAFSATDIPIIAGSHTAYGTFKAPFAVGATTDVQTVTVPFSTFSYDWSPYTGECDTLDPTGVQHHCCSADDDYKYCPTAEYLGSITGFEVWAEGVEGDFHLEILEIAAADTASA